MTEPMSPVLADYGDARRAAALLRHYAANDPAGVVAVLSETAGNGRWVELLLSLAQLCVVVQPDIATEAGLATLADICMALASVEEEPPAMTVRGW